MSKELDGLGEKITSCVLCELSRSRTNAVPGTGNCKSSVIFIGEAPGRNEDLQGKPFVGAAGQILEQCLQYAGFSRDSVFITNVVKCRPPNNRRPNKQEIESCHAYLDKEIEVIQPQIICILGNTAFGSLLDGSSIMKNRGKIIKRGDRFYFVTVHPAAVIYNPELRQVLKNDMKFLAETVDKIKKGIQIQVSE